jgi:hypothetical protein
LKKALLLSVAFAGLTACSGGAVVYSRRPMPPPPSLAVGIVGARPGPGFVWVDGYHDWRGKRYVWVPGRWHKPPRPHAIWVPGSWGRRGPNHVWIRGYWRY